MGQKVNPNSLRFGLNKNWVSRWNAPTQELRVRWLIEDEKVRKLFQSKFRKCGIGHIEIERFVNLDETITVKIVIHMSQIGLFISNEKAISAVNKDLRKILGKRVDIQLDPKELENPSVSAEIIGQEIVDTIQSRNPHRFVVKKVMKRAMMSGAQGIKVKISGRINGVEIARNETYTDGSVPLSTLRADIDYSFQIAKTTYGILGIKVWVNRGLFFGKHFMGLPPKNSGWKTNKEKDNKYISTTY